MYAQYYFMKSSLRTLLCVALASVATISANAQWSKGFTQHELSISYGTLSIITMSDDLEEVEFADVTSANIEVDNRESIGSFTVQYLYRARKKFSFGLSASFQLTKEDCLTADDYAGTSYTKIGELTNRYITIMPSFKFNWIEKKKFAFYSKLALGITFIGDSFDAETNLVGDVESSKQHYFGYQVSPIGFSFGKKICGFIEGGIGTEGVGQAGVQFKF